MKGGGGGRENLWHQGMLLVTVVTLTSTQNGAPSHAYRRKKIWNVRNKHLPKNLKEKENKKKLSKCHWQNLTSLTLSYINVTSRAHKFWSNGLLTFLPTAVTF